MSSGLRKIKSRKETKKEVEERLKDEIGNAKRMITWNLEKKKKGKKTLVDKYMENYW